MRASGSRATLVTDHVGGGSERYKEPDAADLQILDRVAGLPLLPEVPTNAFPIDDMYHGSRLSPMGFTHVHKLFLPSAAHALTALWRRSFACQHPVPA